jgi:cytochrome c oxidase cbb3-type subunit I/II
MKLLKLPVTKEYVKHAGEHWHRVIERRPVQLMIFSLIVILIGGAIEMIPTF